MNTGDWTKVFLLEVLRKLQKLGGVEKSITFVPSVTAIAMATLKPLAEPFTLKSWVRPKTRNQWMEYLSFGRRPSPDEAGELS
jgi:hypothetical protein